MITAWASPASAVSRSVTETQSSDGKAARGLSASAREVNEDIYRESRTRPRYLVLCGWRLHRPPIWRIHALRAASIWAGATPLGRLLSSPIQRPTPGMRERRRQALAPNPRNQYGPASLRRRGRMNQSGIGRSTNALSCRDEYGIPCPVSSDEYGSGAVSERPVAAALSASAAGRQSRSGAASNRPRWQTRCLAEPAAATSVVLQPQSRHPSSGRQRRR